MRYFVEMKGGMQFEIVQQKNTPYLSLPDNLDGFHRVIQEDHASRIILTILIT
jgi:hypothetical protein